MVNTNPISIEFPTGISQDAWVIIVKGAGSGAISLIGTIEGVATTMLTDNTAVQFQHRGGGIWMAWGALGTSASGGISSLGGLTGATQTFGNDTNVTMVSAGTIHTLTWAGTLSDARITSAATWNAKIGGSGTSGQLAFFNATSTITGDSGALYSSGTLTTSTALITTTVAANTLILGKDTSQTSTSYSIQTQGTQTDISIQLVSKGNGDLNITGTSWNSALNISDSSGEIRLIQTGSSVTSAKLRFIGWGGDAGVTTGGDLELLGGAGHTTGVTNGGNVIIKSGARNSTGTDGNISLDYLTGNLSLGASTGSFGSAKGAIFIADVTTAPSGSPTGGSIAYIEASTHDLIIKNPAGVSNRIKGSYTLPLQGHSSSLNDATTYYFSNYPNTPTTTATVRQMYILTNSTITMAEIYSISVTAGSNEAWDMYVRVNNTTDTLIATTSSSSGTRRWTNTGLSINVNAGDYVEIKTVTPTWGTNPLTTIFSGYLYLELR